MSALLRARFEVLYDRDDAGRLLACNEWERNPPPRFHLFRTPAGNFAGASADVDDARASALLALAEAEPWPDDPRTAPVALDRMLELLGADDASAGPAYVLEHVPDQDDPEVLPLEGRMLEGDLEPWRGDIGQREPLLALCENGVARAICCSARMGPVIHEAGVETRSDARQRGFGTRVVAAWARGVRALGAVPGYSTDWTNAGSRAIAARLGGRLVGVDLQIA